MENVSSAKLRNLRKRRMYSQRELAERAGVSLPTVQRIEHGTVKGQPKTLRQLAEALEVDPTELLEKGWEEVPKEDAPLSGHPELKDGIASEEAFGEAYIVGGVRQTVREIDELRALRMLQAQIDEVIDARVRELRREAVG